MKKIAKLMTVLAVAAFTFASCEDVPNPFGPVTPPTTDGDDTNTELPYTSVNLNSGWTLEAVSADQPWSQGSSYVQATGYQTWDGAESKSNRAVEGWLVSPAFSTKGYENVKIWFDQTIKYATYTGWEANHKIYVSNNYDESNFGATTWVEVADFTPAASKFSDWTLYSSGELQLPASMAGQEAIHIAFYFKAPADKSTTWELKNFNIAEGIADNTGGGDTPAVDPDMGTEDKPFDVASAIAAGDKTGVYLKGYIVGSAYYNGDTKQNELNFGTTNAQATNLLLAATATETDATKCMPIALPSGAIRTALNIKDNAGNIGKEVLLYGNLTKYFGQPGMKETSYAVLNGTAIGTKPGGGTEPPSSNLEAGQYFFIIQVDGTYKEGIPVASDKDYGYITLEDATITDGKLAGKETHIFTFTKEGDGYTIQDASNRYYYMDDSHTSFQVAAAKPASNHIWSVNVGSDGKATITNIGRNKVLDYSTQYKNLSPGSNGGGYPMLLKQGAALDGGGSSGGGDTGGGDTGGGDSSVGTYANPYTVTSGIAAEGDGASTKVEKVYIKGYIVGWVSGQVLADGAHFDGTATVKSNILIAASASETTLANCMPVQLPSGAVRTGINLQDNASVYGKEVLLYGNLEKYFGAAGVKTVTYAEIEGSAFGTKPQ